MSKVIYLDDGGHCYRFVTMFNLGLKETNMAITLNPEIREIINTVHYRAWLSMKTRINSKNEFANTVRVAADKAKAELCSC